MSRNGRGWERVGKVGRGWEGMGGGGRDGRDGRGKRGYSPHILGWVCHPNH